MVPTARLLSVIAFGMFAFLTSARAEPPSDVDTQSADLLWQSFLGKYNEFSLHPLAAADLDEKARAALISAAGPKFRSWKPDAQPTFLEMAAAIVAQDASVSKFTRIERALESLLPQIDTYGYYKSAADVAQWLEALRQNPGSVQMTLDQAPDGRVLCYPSDGGPAELAGIHAGAVLLAVDDRPSEGKTLSNLRLAFVGPPDSPIRLKVRQPQGKVEGFTVTRTDKAATNISVIQSPLGLTLRIRKFDKGSARTVKQLLEPYPKTDRLTIDLRGNPGGLREEAFMVATLFFPEGTPLGKFTTGSGVQTANDGNGVFITAASIRILQDRRTASAAEYLIAALKEGLPDKVTLFGEKTYGKSHSTAHVILDGGGELSVTEALLSTAAGKSWDKTGVLPDTSAEK